MTDEQFEPFSVALRHLHSAYGKSMSPTAANLWFGIFRNKGVPLEVFQSASVNAITAERLMPRIATMLAYCDKVFRVAHEDVALFPVRPADGAEWAPVCEACQDSGWWGFFCPGRGGTLTSEALARQHTRREEEQGCSRPNPHGCHSWVKPCPCRATNTEYQRMNPIKPGTFSTEPERQSKWGA